MWYYCHLPCAISCSRKLLRKCIHGKLLCCCCFFLTIWLLECWRNRRKQTESKLSKSLTTTELLFLLLWSLVQHISHKRHLNIQPTTQLSIPHGPNGGGGSATTSTDKKVLLTICCTKSHKTWFTHSVWLITQFSWPEPLKARLLSISSSSSAAASSYWTQCKSALEGRVGTQQKQKMRRNRWTNCTASTITMGE